MRKACDLPRGCKGISLAAWLRPLMVEGAWREIRPGGPESSCARGVLACLSMDAKAPPIPSAGAGDLAFRLARAIDQVAPRDLVSAYFFGSRAAGRDHRESDLDVGILLQREVPERELFDERVRLAAVLPGLVGIRDVDVIVLNEAPPQLARAIVLDGIRLVCRDAEADHSFRRDVQLRAADLEPFLRRTRAVKLAALSR